MAAHRRKHGVDTLTACGNRTALHEREYLKLFPAQARVPAVQNHCGAQPPPAAWKEPSGCQQRKPKLSVRFIQMLNLKTNSRRSVVQRPHMKMRSNPWLPAGSR